MKLIEEECMNAATRLYRPYYVSVKIQNAYYDINGKDNSIDKDSNLIEQLIKEHFKLVKQLQDEVDKYKHEYYAMCDLVENPQPYKFEDLKPHMFVFDKDFNGWGEILRIVETSVNEYGEKIVKCLATGDGSLQTRSYKENRFFPATKAMQYQNNK